MKKRKFNACEIKKLMKFKAPKFESPQSRKKEEI